MKRCLTVLFILSSIASTIMEEDSTGQNEGTCREGGRPICSNRGRCVFGRCVCDRRRNSQELIGGEYCECDNFSCPRSENGSLLCSGLRHGKCECGGKCACKKPKWSGAACECRVNQMSCRPNSTAARCNDHGICSCHKCSCDDGYSGTFCNIKVLQILPAPEKLNYTYTSGAITSCPNCTEKCNVLKDCIQCYVHGTSSVPDGACQYKCQDAGIVSFQNIEEVRVVASAGEHETYCSVIDSSDKCRFYFVFGYRKSNSTRGAPATAADGRRLYVRAQEIKDCPPKPPVMWIILGVIFGVFVIVIFCIALGMCSTFLNTQ